jgi:Zn-dependent protease
MQDSIFYIEKKEAIEILICVLAISFAFALVFYGLGGLLRHTKDFIIFTAICTVAVGSGFIFHEMGHKIVAIYYGAYARFNMWVNGLAFMLITAMFGMLFASPGAVYIYSNTITKKQNGLISLVGPMINVLIMFIFMFLALFAPVRQFFTGLDADFFGISGGLVNVWAFGAGVNLILAMFNMIPAFPLDGSKVFAWSWPIWGAVTLSLLGFAATFFSPGLVISFAILFIIAIIFSRLAFGSR